ncbi:glycosyltransferase [Fusibacillus kribbianus]|uniref:Glycosyltransferase n=1 Tax=Fusibacillus kribbianus TaxID=3044208 RepID=A0AAP4B890_9FIRM|nr:glycosyltransferase [Ruminococcus sp. YH-rum2234]MDI9241559.1 glycosyltransferase [Ruminococcus sp. YH-rum2234]
MKRVLFLIHDLGQGGAEKVLVNLVNNMDDSKFDITVMTLFDSGENRQFLGKNVRYKTWCKKMIPGNSHLMKLLSPKQLHKLIIKEHYDIEISYLEGPCARVISGCSDPTVKMLTWIHIEQHTAKRAAVSFRNVAEAKECYGRFDRIICVSQTVKQDFLQALQIPVPHEVLYNTNESDKIIRLSQEAVEPGMINPNEIKLVGVGKLLKSKGFDRVARIVKRLKEQGYPVHLYILGEGPERNSLQEYIQQNGLEHSITLLGYQINPYRYVAKCDLFVCASFAEGFSTAATEALIVGTPVCTVEVSGMKEMLGENNEYGLVVENNEEALYQGIKRFFVEPGLLEYYTKQAERRGKYFSAEKTVQAVEKLLIQLCEEKV